MMIEISALVGLISFILIWRRKSERALPSSSMSQQWMREHIYRAGTGQH